MPRRNNATFTEKELLFIQHFEGDQTEAARQAGLKDPGRQGSRMMQRPHVKQAIEAKLAAAVKESGTQLGQRVTVTRSEIINGLHKEGKEADTASARVSAWAQLAEIFQLKKNSTKESDIFTGWNNEELDLYHRTGQLPAWFGLSADESNNGDHGNHTTGPGLSAGATPAVPSGDGHGLGKIPSPSGETPKTTPGGKPTRRTN